MKSGREFQTLGPSTNLTLTLILTLNCKFVLHFSSAVVAKEGVSESETSMEEYPNPLWSWQIVSESRCMSGRDVTTRCPSTDRKQFH